MMTLRDRMHSGDNRPFKILITGDILVKFNAKYFRDRKRNFRAAHSWRFKNLHFKNDIDDFFAGGTLGPGFFRFLFEDPSIRYFLFISSW